MTTPRIAMIVNKPEREDPIFERIAKMLERVDDNIATLRLEYRDTAFNKKLTAFEPTALLTFPLTSRGIAQHYYALKYALDCRIVSYRTEGQISISDANYSAWMVGFDEYGPNLVDWELFWGELSAEVVGKALVAQGKLASMSRTRTVGYARYESHFDHQQQLPETPAEQQFYAMASGRPREHVAFFILAEYTVEDLVRGGDVFQSRPPAPKEIHEAEKAIAKCRAYRERWIDAALETARRCPEMLVVFKSHPVENIIFARQGRNPYDRLRGHDNILYLDTPVRIDLILRRSGLFFHYGSTVAAEAYIADVPCIFATAFDFYPENEVPENPAFYFHDLGWPSTAKLDIAAVPDFVARHMREPVRFVCTERMRWILDKVFAIHPKHISGQSHYSPSQKIAALLVSCSGMPPLDPLADGALCVNALTRDKAGWILEVMAGREQKAMGERRYDDARRLLDRMDFLASLHGHQEPVLAIMRAQLFVAQKQIEEARKVLRTELAAHPENNFAREYLARLGKAAFAAGGDA